MSEKVVFFSYILQRFFFYSSAEGSLDLYQGFAHIAVAIISSLLWRMYLITHHKEKAYVCRILSVQSSIQVPVIGLHYLLS